MQFLQLTYFIEIVEKGSMNKAAGSLFITQSSLSKSMNQLEKELDVELFKRSNKRIQLTAAGQKLYEYARTVTAQVHLIRNLKNDQASLPSLRVSAYPAPSNARLLAEYARGLDFSQDLSLREKRVSRILEDVKSLEAEIGLIQYTEVQEKELRHLLKHNHLSSQEYDQDTWQVVVGPNHPLFHQDAVKMADTIGYPIVRIHDDYFSNLNYFLTIDGHRLDQFQRTVFIDSVGGILNYLTASDGIHLACSSEGELMKAWGFRSLPILNNDRIVRRCWIKRDHEILSESAQRFIRILTAAHGTGQR